MQWPPLSAIFTVELPVEQGHAETRYSSWRLHKESFQEKGQEVGYKVWPTGLQERKEAPTGNAAATDSEKRPWGRPRAFHMKVVAFDWWKWTTRLKLMTNAMLLPQQCSILHCDFKVSFSQNVFFLTLRKDIFGGIWPINLKFSVLISFKEISGMSIDYFCTLNLAKVTSKSAHKIHPPKMGSLWIGTVAKVFF